MDKLIKIFSEAGEFKNIANNETLHAMVLKCREELMERIDELYEKMGGESIKFEERPRPQIHINSQFSVIMEIRRSEETGYTAILASTTRREHAFGGGEYPLTDVSTPDLIKVHDILSELLKEKENDGTS